MKSDKEFLGEKRESKIIKTELLDSLFYYLAICGGRIACKRPVGGELINQWG